MMPGKSNIQCSGKEGRWGHKEERCGRAGRDRAGRGRTGRGRAGGAVEKTGSESKLLSVC